MLKQREAKMVASSKKVRQVKVDESQWEAAVEISPQEESAAPVAETKKTKKNKNMHFDEFVKKQGGGRGRGGRGRGRGGARSTRQEGGRAKLDDPNAFPALGQN
jgi:hypothetical protein